MSYEGKSLSATVESLRLNRQQYRHKYIDMYVEATRTLTVASLWNSINRDTLRDHRLEENDAYARLIMGYSEPAPGDLVSA